MKITAASASGLEIDPLLSQLIPTLEEGLDNHSPNIGFFFASNHFDEELPEAVQRIQERFQISHLVGCTGDGIIGPNREYEQEPCFSLWVGQLPAVDLQSFHLSPFDLESVVHQNDWQNLIRAKKDDETNLILLGDPFSFNVSVFLNGINQNLPKCRIVGGMASGATSPGHSMLIHNNRIYHEGAVCVCLSGGLKVDSVVSQGCRPIGKPQIITGAEKNVIQHIGGKPSLEIIQELYDSSSERDRSLIEQGMFLGRAIDEYQGEFKRGDFLIRNLIGADKNTGSITVMDHVQAGITVQFHIRDAETADEDLRALLTPHTGMNPDGVLLFSCNGRGTRMYPDSNHDLNLLRERLDSPPIAGFFCAGELGPVGGKNFIHGHTAAVALFKRK